LLSHPAVRSVAQAHQATAAQVLLAFLLSDENVIAIPKSSSPEHTLENAGAASIELTDAQLHALFGAFPAPQKKTPLDNHVTPSRQNRARREKL
jgi:diketogulonate reductase-like aldo/keto reductase